MKLSWKALLIFFAIFVTGVVTGGVLALHWFKKRPLPSANKPTLEQYSRNQLNTVAERLHLSEEQKNQLKPAFTQANEELKQLRRQGIKQTLEILDRTNAEVEKVLSPEQKDIFSELKLAQRERIRTLLQGLPGARRELERANKKDAVTAPGQAAPPPPPPSKSPTH